MKTRMLVIMEVHPTPIRLPENISRTFSGIRPVSLNLKRTFITYIVVDFYECQEHPAVTAMKEEEVEQWRRDNQIICQGDLIPKPVLSFEVSPFPGMILKLIVQTSNHV